MLISEFNAVSAFKLLVSWTLDASWQRQNIANVFRQRSAMFACNHNAFSDSPRAASGAPAHYGKGFWSRC